MSQQQNRSNSITSTNSNGSNSNSLYGGVADGRGGGGITNDCNGGMARAPSAEAVGSSSLPPHHAHGHSFRRQRAARACETCHARKVRCDAASLGVPCTNCVAFSIDCKIPTPKRKKLSLKKEDNERKLPNGPLPIPRDMMNYDQTLQTHGSPSEDSTPLITNPSLYSQIPRPKFARAPIKEAGRVAYLGESSNLSLIVPDKPGSSEVVHYPLPENIRGTPARLTELDTIEIDILNQRGAFLLPPRALCDELVAAYFKWVAPIVPVINRSRFMRRYRDPKNPPSLLLLQSVLLAGSRVCDNLQLKDPGGSTTPAAMTFYKRAKALYDANYEDDRVTIVQSLVLMGWYWEGPEDVTKNVFYWSRVATIVAQGSGMHRSVEHSQLSQADKRLWKRIWWTLFTRDRSVAVALGRPVHINTDDSDVEMVTAEDFLDDEPGFPAEFTPDPLHVQYFLHHVKLCEIMGIVLAQQYSVASKARQRNGIDLVHSDLALADWMLHVPPEMRYHIEDKSRQNFWAALLHSTYYTTLCLLHRAHMPPAISSNNGNSDDEQYPSRNIAFRAAHAITSIVDNLVEHNELKYCPAFFVYSLFSALIMHIYQMRSENIQVVAETRERTKKCMDALKEVSQTWVVAKMVFTLFESILGNKKLEERFAKSAGRRHRSRKRQDNNNSATINNGNGTSGVNNDIINGINNNININSSNTGTNNGIKFNKAPHTPANVPQQPTCSEPVKRKFHQMELGSMPTGPVPTMSYERSRPTTPGPLTVDGSHSQTQNPMTPGGQSIKVDTMLGGTSTGPTSQGVTQPTTPFNPMLSIPATPPDLFLVTRDRGSPTISQSLWENFQPNHLFPDDSGVAYLSPPTAHLTLDPQLQPDEGGYGGISMAEMGPTLSLDPNQKYPLQWGSDGNTFDPSQLDMGRGGGQPQPQQQMSASPGSPDDTWSNSSTGGIVPTTLNVEDWFNFFGLNEKFLDIL